MLDLVMFRQPRLHGLVYPSLLSLTGVLDHKLHPRRKKTILNSVLLLRQACGICKLLDQAHPSRMEWHHRFVTYHLR